MQYSVILFMWIIIIIDFRLFLSAAVSIHTTVHIYTQGTYNQVAPLQFNLMNQKIKNSFPKSSLLAVNGKTLCHRR